MAVLIFVVNDTYVKSHAAINFLIYLLQGMLRVRSTGYIQTNPSIVVVLRVMRDKLLGSNKMRPDNLSTRPHLT